MKKSKCCGSFVVREKGKFRCDECDLLLELEDIEDEVTHE